MAGGLSSNNSRVNHGFHPLPSPKQGRLLRIKELILDQGVSIRSPHRSKGRFRNSRASESRLGGFNPLPSPEAREIGGRPAWREVPEVSIRSPHRSKGRSAPCAVMIRVLPSFQSAPLTEARGDVSYAGTGWKQHSVSIRSPHRSKGRFGTLLTSLKPHVCFNPLPSPKQGEISGSCSQAFPFHTFQSAPLTEARGDRALQARPLTSV